LIEPISIFAGADMSLKVDDLEETRDIFSVELFVGLLDRKTIECASCYAEMVVAKTKGVPIFYVVPKGVTIPKEYTEGVKYLQIKVLDQYYLDFPNPQDPIAVALPDIDAFVIDMRSEGVFK
jgi:hypothetical protein